jgi:predicted ATP-dependent endonuclease of OLD family
MKIKKIKIEGVGAIESLALEFNGSTNLICGPNAIGKTTVIESIAHIFLMEKQGTGANKIDKSYAGSFCYHTFCK